MNVDNGGAKRKLLAMQSFTNKFPLFLKDAGAYIMAKIVDSILNGESGENYPKSYPEAVSEGQGGYVGVVTSNLRRSIGITLEDQGMVVLISQVNKALAPYHNDMLLWTEEKYGMTFYEIAVKLYGAKVATEMLRFIKDLVIKANQGKELRYSNRF